MPFCHRLVRGTVTFPPACLGRVFKLGTEPIEDGRELNKAQKVEGQLLVARPDPAEALDPLKEILHSVP